MAKQMKAVHYKEAGPAQNLELQTIDIPTPGENDILVQIKATAVNPVDYKIREGGIPGHDITGFDAAGVIEEVGSAVKGFKKGDEVFYSGALGRAGSSAQYNLIDYRLTAHKPKNLDWVHAAAFPLVSITAWELLGMHWHLEPEDPSGKQAKKSILIINGAGGVGSIATQLARKVFKLGKVIVTASRPETIEHAKKMGATHVIDHHKDLKPQIQKDVGIDAVDYIFICHSTGQYLPVAVDIAAPWGQIGSIVEVTEQLPALHSQDAFMKSLSFTWELMLCKTVYGNEPETQGQILKQIAELCDKGVLESLVTDTEELSVKGLIKAHEKLESGKSIGKICLTVGDDIQ